MNKKYVKKIYCNVCGKPFEILSTSMSICCPKCKGNKHKALNRIFTKGTVKIICNWYENGDTIDKIGTLLNRSEQNVIKALKEGGKVM